MHRVLVVPWSRAAAYFGHVLVPLIAMNSRRPRAAALSSRCVRRGARVLVPDAARAEVAGAALARHERDRRLHALLGRVGGRVRAPPPRRAVRRRRAQRLDGRQSASTIVLSPGSALPRAWTPSTPASSAAVQPSRSSSDLPAADWPICRKSVPYSGPAAPPTLETSAMPTVFSTAPMSSPSARVELLERPCASRGPCSCRGRRRRSPCRAASARLAARRPRRRSAGSSPRPAPYRAARPAVTRPSAAPACPPARPTAASARRRAAAA